MGGCASVPKETNGALPVEAPATETVPQENGNGDETQKEAPLVDLSEPKPDETAEAKSAEPETVTRELDASASESPVEPTETKVVVAEDKPDAAAVTEEGKEAAEAKSS
ncbi:uncharacterized protein LOC115733595 [Rhodamnia argentea]|uniref:Uncharacterized protein LOC115733595 n=1 Tax=Rhodamnia argentea TaxID=178133 RepID=A0A8B8NCC3_9MYRT|nr:uncharacterized protein LOC115733595 [Rhodamnia argentea]